MIQIQNQDQEERKNITKIKYICIGGKIYKVTDMSIAELHIEAAETELSIAEIPDNELWKIEELVGQYQIKLINSQKRIKVINIDQWKQNKQR